MSKYPKPTFDFIKKSFAERGYSLLSEEYINAGTKLDYICDKGHRWSTSWTKFRLGRGCAFCCNAPPVSHQEVVKAFSDRGYKLIDVYKGSRQKLNYICPNNEPGQINWDEFNNKGRGCRCDSCIKPTAIQIRFEDRVKRLFQERGYKLINEFSIQRKEELFFICPYGSLASVSWRNFTENNSGCRCLFCAPIKKRNKPQKHQSRYPLNPTQLRLPFRGQKCRTSAPCKPVQLSLSIGNHKRSANALSHEFVNSQFKAKGYKLISTYRRNLQPLIVICPSNHQYKTSWSVFNKGIGCPVCAGNAVIPYGRVKALAEAQGCSLLTPSDEYKNSQQSLQMICNSGHFRTTNYSNMIRFSGCQSCLREKMRAGGKGTPNWKDISPEERLLRKNRNKTPGMTAWRSSVLRRDDYSCQCCGSQVYLEAHHLYGYAEYVKLRANVSNGITLCRYCHDLYHGMFGLKATREKFQAFINACNLDTVLHPMNP